MHSSGKTQAPGHIMDSAIGCPTLSFNFNSNYLQNGLMEFDLVCGH